jgi:hypothetical protein
MPKLAAPEFERRLLTPRKSLQVKSSRIPRSRSVKIIHDGFTVSNVRVDSMPFSRKVDIGIRKVESKIGPDLVTARFSSKEAGFQLFLDEPSKVVPVRVEGDLEAGMGL